LGLWKGGHRSYPATKAAGAELAISEENGTPHPSFGCSPGWLQTEAQTCGRDTRETDHILRRSKNGGQAAWDQFEGVGEAETGVSTATGPVESSIASCKKFWKKSPE